MEPANGVTDIRSALASEGVEASPSPALLEGFEQPRDGFRASIWAGGSFEHWDWDGWRAAATAMAAGLREKGVQPGSRVACVLTNCPAACAAVPAIWLAGGTVLSLPTIAR